MQRRPQTAAPRAENVSRAKSVASSPNFQIRHRSSMSLQISEKFSIGVLRPNASNETNTQSTEQTKERKSTVPERDAKPSRLPWRGLLLWFPSLRDAEKETANQKKNLSNHSTAPLYRPTIFFAAGRTSMVVMPRIRPLPCVVRFIVMPVFGRCQIPACLMPAFVVSQASSYARASRRPTCCIRKKWMRALAHHRGVTGRNC
jgi:hypothetical protein